MENIRSFVRPLLTLSGWGLLLYLAIVGNDGIRMQVVSLVGMMVGFWFAERKK